MIQMYVDSMVLVAYAQVYIRTLPLGKYPYFSTFRCTFDVSFISPVIFESIQQPSSISVAHVQCCIFFEFFYP